MPKKMVFRDEARQAMKRGIDKLADAVQVTLGPRGRNVVIDEGFQVPLVTKDGVTVAKAVDLEDRLEAAGANILRQAASKTNDIAGDGTTTATVLARAMIHEGLKWLGKTNPLALKRGMERAVEALVAELKTNINKPLADNDIGRVASISANDLEIGSLIAEAFQQMGRNGILTVEETSSNKVQIEMVNGMRFDRGYISNYMVTDQEKNIVEYEDVKILITDQKISTIEPMIPLLEKMVKENLGRLLIIADDVEGDALATFIMNKVQKKFFCVAVKGPGFAERRKDLLQDIAILTGGKYIASDLNLRLEDVTTEDLGSCRKVQVTKDQTTIVDGKGDRTKIDERVASLKTLKETTESQFEKDKIDERVAKLTGGIGVIKVGAATETEMHEKKHRIEDAIAATKAALEEGIVPGGGVALIRAQKALKELAIFGDEYLGLCIVEKAIEEPLKAIAENAGKNGSSIVKHVKRLDGSNGYNAEYDHYEDLIQSGVIDPAKVTRCALQNAVSVAGLFLTTECLLSAVKEK